MNAKERQQGVCARLPSEFLAERRCEWEGLPGTGLPPSPVHNDCSRRLTGFRSQAGATAAATESILAVIGDL